MVRLAFIAVGALNCLSDMNEPRTAAGLSELKAPAASTEQTKVANALGKEGKTETTKYLQDLCTDLIATNPPKTTTKGTVAYHVQTGSEGSCSAAVDYWKSGFSLFNNQLPPSYSSSSPSDIYKNGQAVSFVALYNPKPGPTAECAFVKCPATTNTTPSTPPSSSGGSQTPNSQGVSNGLSSPQNQSQEEKNPVSSAAAAGHSVEPSSNEQNSPSDDANQARVIRLAGASGSNAQESDSKTVNAVVCLVSPPALEDGKAPFTIVKPPASMRFHVFGSIVKLAARIHVLSFARQYHLISRNTQLLFQNRIDGDALGIAHETRVRISSRTAEH
ncbi:SAG family member [Cyclospora cayetanensis]|uniref:SAG family member n=1 Tax=Cyclospora cayetanensis TaxID=88456 RepID=A0A1D3CZ74_9EIME|nr:SAG family member [Cyclospora cayetanensis]